MLALAETAVEGDPRWAARLATYLLQVDASDRAAQAARQDAFLRVAQTTTSTNERNYLLGLILEENGDINFEQQLAPLNTRAYTTLSSLELLNRLKYRLRAEDADDVELSFNLDVEGEDFVLAVHNNVLRITPGASSGDTTLEMSREDLVAVTARTRALTAVPGWNRMPMAGLTALIE